MGDLQYDANARLAELVALRGGELIVIGRTNASALESGYENRPRRFLRRDSAVAWVRANLGPGDGVLYLNDLPDHYP